MENEKYYDKPPQKGGKRISFYDAHNVNGILDPPIHDAELLKTRLQKLFDDRFKKIIEDNDINLVETKEEYKNQCYLLCLKDELPVINQWLSNTEPNGQEKEIKVTDAERIQILKYQTFINEKIKEIEPHVTELLQSSEQGFPNNFKPKDGLNEVVYKDYIFQFGEIEKELIGREYLSGQYQWLENKTTLCEFLVVIINLKYTKVSDVKVRRFFEKRYGMDNNSLSGMFKPSKRPKLKTANSSFSFISTPEKIS